LHGKEETADKWLDSHEFAEAFTDDAEDAWMAV
jgi:hypothetical protein